MSMTQTESTVLSEAEGHTTEAVGVEAASVTLPPPISEWKRVLSGIGPVFWIAVGWVILITLLAVLVYWLPLRRYGRYDFDHLYGGFSGKHLLGTNNEGDDLLGLSIQGARISLYVGIITTLLGTLAGGALGICAGYFGGKVDGVISFCVDVLLSFPALVLLLAVVSFLGGASIRNLVIGLGLLAIPALARITRANTLPFVRREFVTAARALGAKNRRVIIREILPNVLPPMLSFGITLMAIIIVADGALAFLGLGLDKRHPTWGGLILGGRNYLDQAPQISLVPCGFLTLTVLSLTFIGDRLQARFSGRGARI